MIVERVRPQDDYRLFQVARAALTEPLLKGLRSERRDLALRSDTCQFLCYVPQQRRMGEEVCNARHECCQPRPPVDQAHSIGGKRAQPSFIVMREKFSFIGCHIDIYRAVTFTPFAGKAEVQRLFYFFAAPATL